MRYLFCISLALALLARSDFIPLAAMGSAGAAENPPYVDQCTDQGKPFSIETRIDGCSAIINSGQYKGKDLSWAFINRGNLYSIIGNYDSALGDFTEAIALDPTNGMAYDGRCFVHNSRGENDLALADCDEAIKLDPNNALAYNNRGNAWRAKNDLDRAIGDYTDAIRLEPKYVMAYNNRGDAYGMKIDYEHAIADFSESIRLDPGNAEVFNARCWARAIAGRELQQAVADCGESLRMRPNDANTHDSLAFTYFKLGDLDRALAEYHTALELNPKIAVRCMGAASPN